MSILDRIGLDFFRCAYFDHNATTRVLPAAARAAGECMTKTWGNPSSLHGAGLQAKGLLEASRTEVASCIKASPEELYFTSGGTESNNLAIISGAAEGLRRLPANVKPRAITSSVEHSSVTEAFEHLGKTGIEVIYLPVTSVGEVLPSELGKALCPGTILVSIMMANNEVGTIMNIAELSAMASKTGALFHTDAVQAFGKIPIDLSTLPHVSMMTVSSHKVYGPKGVGAFFIRKGVAIDPRNHGGHQEKGVRGGTENLPGIAGFAAAARTVCQEMTEKSRHCEALRRYLYQKLKEIDPCIEMNGPASKSLANTLNLHFPGCDNRELLAFLSVNGISVSTGAACSEGREPFSPVLTAMGLTPERAGSSLRISFGRENTPAEVRHFVTVFKRFREQRGQVTMISVPDLDRFIADNENVHILDIRFDYERRMAEGLPGSHETSIFSLAGECADIPRDKNILIVCQNGLNAFLAAQYLKMKGFRNLFILPAGVSGYKLHKRLFG